MRYIFIYTEASEDKKLKKEVNALQEAFTGVEVITVRTMEKVEQIVSSKRAKEGLEQKDVIVVHATVYSILASIYSYIAAPASQMQNELWLTVSYTIGGSASLHSLITDMTDRCGIVLNEGHKSYTPAFNAGAGNDEISSWHGVSVTLEVTNYSSYWNVKLRI